MAKEKRLTAEVVIKALGACNVPSYITPRMSPKQGFEAMMVQGYGEEIAFIAESLHLNGKTKPAERKLRVAFPHLSREEAQGIVRDHPHLSLSWEQIEQALQSRRVQKTIKEYLNDPDAG
jgi:hypothetical protein